MHFFVCCIANHVGGRATVLATLSCVCGGMLVSVWLWWHLSSPLASTISLIILVCARGASGQGAERAFLLLLLDVRLLALPLRAVVWYHAVRLVPCPPAPSSASGTLVGHHLALAFIG